MPGINENKYGTKVREIGTGLRPVPFFMALQLRRRSGPLLRDLLFRRRWCPAAAQRAIQLHDGGVDVTRGLQQRQIGIEGLPFRIQNLEVAGNAAAIARLGQAQAFAFGIGDALLALGYLQDICRA